ncbi:putative covalently-linked cell wall protein [Diplogelasinospora grovesii]|uniref:Covalently-linked cell wall protein n=1 Tax=Diplogelasinospora grovesii TaxID=303347 RepID=A0AAN6N888_9PEZI|nr:putative covalently-linked cell wall protein [Diplogelasinospora grovesii]
MKHYSLALLAFASSVSAQAVTDKIAPTVAAPAGCQPSMSGSFEISIVDAKTAKRDLALQKRAACSGNGILVATLADGVLTDGSKRTGYVASNYQFQFDGPPQAGAIYTAGFSACGNGTLALGGSTTFYQCKSGDFYNLYDRYWAAQCSPVEIMIMPCGGDGAASQKGDGQVVGTSIVTTTVVVPLSDGQPQVITTTVPVPLCQISDGQLQVHTTPCASITATPTPSTVLPPVSQYTDGQIQVTPVVPATPSPTATGVSVPVPTGPIASISPSIAPNPTLHTTAVPNSSKAVVTGPGASTSAPAVVTNAAGRIEMGSVAALVVGLVGAVWFL